MKILPVDRKIDLAFLRDIGLMRMAIHGENAPFEDLEEIWRDRTPPTVRRTFKEHVTDFFAGKDMSAGSYSAHFSNFASTGDAVLKKDGTFFPEKRIDLLSFAAKKSYLSDEEKDAAKKEVESFSGGQISRQGARPQGPLNRD